MQKRMEDNINDPILEIEPVADQEVFSETDDQEDNHVVDAQDDEPPPVNEPIDDKGLMVVHDDNIVSEEEAFLEEEDHEEEIHTNEVDNIPAVVAELDDQVEGESYSRPRRANAGAGIERI